MRYFAPFNSHEGPRRTLPALVRAKIGDPERFGDALQRAWRLTELRPRWQCGSTLRVLPRRRIAHPNPSSAGAMMDIDAGSGTSTTDTESRKPSILFVIVLRSVKVRVVVEPVASNSNS